MRRGGVRRDVSALFRDVEPAALVDAQPVGHEVAADLASAACRPAGAATCTWAEGTNSAPWRSTGSSWRGTSSVSGFASARVQRASPVARSRATARPDGALIDQRAVEADRARRRCRGRDRRPTSARCRLRGSSAVRRARCERPLGTTTSSPASIGSPLDRHRQLAPPQRLAAVQTDAVRRAGAAARARRSPRPPRRAIRATCAQKRAPSPKRQTTSPLARSSASSVPSRRGHAAARARCARAHAPLSPCARKRKRGWPVRRSIATRCLRVSLRIAIGGAMRPPATGTAPAPPRTPCGLRRARCTLPSATSCSDELRRRAASCSSTRPAISVVARRSAATTARRRCRARARA